MSKNLFIKADKLISKKIQLFHKLGTLAKIRSRCGDDAVEIHFLHKRMLSICLELEPMYSFVVSKYAHLKPIIDGLKEFYDH